MRIILTKTILLSTLIIVLFLLSSCNFLVEEPPPNGLDPVPFVDGFDFPVGNPDGDNWSVSGYDFCEWSSYSNSFHPGEDWNLDGPPLADWGAPVYSIAHGVVTFSGWNTAQGNIVQIEHRFPNGTKVWSQYAHLENRYVKVNDIVTRRDLIGTVGRGPGNAFSPHLHFEIRRKFLPQNAWPRTNGIIWPKSKVWEYYIKPSDFINQNRP